MGQTRLDDEPFFCDSLQQQALSEGFLCHDYYFSYPSGDFAIDTDSSVYSQELQELAAFLRFVTSRSTFPIARIRLTGYSSFEGDYRTNEVLSRKRVHAFYRYLREKYPELYRFPYDLAWVAEDWNGLSRLVRNSNIAKWEEILEIIRKVPSLEERERLLLRLDSGRAYSTLKRLVFPKLGRVEIRVEYETLLSALSDPQSVSSSSLFFEEGRYESVENRLGVDDVSLRSSTTSGNDKFAHKPTYSLASPPPLSIQRSVGEGQGRGVYTPEKVDSNNVYVMGTESENDEIRFLKLTLRQKEFELRREKMRADLYETMVDVAEEQFNIYIRKKAGAKQ